MQARQREADEFYRAITPKRVSEDGALVMRQALAGMLWSKQYFGLRRGQVARRNMAWIRCGRAANKCATANGSTW